MKCKKIILTIYCIGKNDSGSIVLNKTVLKKKL